MSMPSSELAWFAVAVGAGKSSSKPYAFPKSCCTPSPSSHALSPNTIEHGARLFRRDFVKVCGLAPGLFSLPSPALARKLAGALSFPNQGVIMGQPALTVTEVVALSGVEEGRVRKDVEHGFFGSESPPTFSLADLVYFRMLALLDIQLGVDDRKKVYHLIAKALSGPGKPTNIEVSPVLELKLAKVARDVADTLNRFEAWKKKVVVNQKILGGEPVFPKSRLSVRHIGGMFINGAPVAEILEDYPYIKEEDIEFAKLYTLAYPKRGRPRERKAPAAR